MLGKSKGIGIGAGGGGDGNVLNTNIFYVSSLADLPDPDGSDNIIIPADYGLFIDGKTVDLGVNNLVLSGDTTIEGMQSVSALTSSHPDGTIVNGGGFTLSIDKLDLYNTSVAVLVYSMDDNEAVLLTSSVQLFGNVNIGRFRILVFHQVQSFATLTFNSFANGTFIADQTAWIQFFPFDSIVFEAGSSVIEVTLGSVINFLTELGGNGIVIENPDSISRGNLNGVTLVGPGNFLSCNPIFSTSFDLPVGGNNNSGGLGFDGSNLISCDIDTNEIFLHDGLSQPVTDTVINTFGGSVRGMVWAKGNLVYIDKQITESFIVINEGFSLTLIESFSFPGVNPMGITFDGTNLISIDQVTGIHVHIGMSVLISENFLSPAPISRDITFDGVNIIVIDNDDIVYVMKGISSTVQYQFSIGLPDLRGLVITDVGAVISTESSIGKDKANVFTHPITFDHSSSTWDMTNNSSNIVESSDRGGSQYQGGNVPILLAQNVWKDISDFGASIFYGSFNAMEKCRLNDETNGEIIWTGVRDRGRTLSAQVVATRSGGSGDEFYEVAIVINGVVQTDGKGAGVLPSANSFVTINSLPITRDLIAGDLIKAQIMNSMSNADPEVSMSSLSIT